MYFGFCRLPSARLSVCVCVRVCAPLSAGLSKFSFSVLIHFLPRCRVEVFSESVLAQKIL